MRNQNRAFLRVAFFAIIIFSLPLVGSASVPQAPPDAALLSSSDIQVNPIENLSPDFIMGADVSMLKEIEDNGGKFSENGEQKDALTILKDHGINWIRLRIWNDPTDAAGNPLGGGNNDLATTVALATRAKGMGFKFLLDFHYSDFWADPGQQNIPKAWVGLNLDDLEKAVYDYTANVIQTLVKANAMPDMVQIGNEVNDGMLWPLGKVTKVGDQVVGGFDGFAGLLKSGIQAVRDNDPQKSAKIMIHVSNGGDNKLFRTVFDALTERKVDFDVIGLSYYPYWIGTMDDLKSNMADISQRYNKDVVIAETAYAATLNDQDGFANLFNKLDQNLGGYEATVQGQATAIRDVMDAVAQVPNNRGLGIFYWEPDWIPVQGAGWKTGEGDAWENQALFTFKGAALRSMNVFNLVKPGSGSVNVPATFSQAFPLLLDTTLGEAPTLPNQIPAVFSDDSIRNVPVVWDAVDPSVFGQAGDVTVHGTVTGTGLNATATITVSKYKNYVLNPGFEDSDFTSWTVTGDSDAADISKDASNVHTGSYALHYWKDSPFAFTVSQTVTNLPDGTYSLSAWIQGGGGENSLQLVASDYGGGAPLSADVKNTGWLVWSTPTIPQITVTGGKVTISLKVDSPAGSWAFMDDVSLVKVD